MNLIWCRLIRLICESKMKPSRNIVQSPAFGPLWVSARALQVQINAKPYCLKPCLPALMCHSVLKRDINHSKQEADAIRKRALPLDELKRYNAASDVDGSSCSLAACQCLLADDGANRKPMTVLIDKGISKGCRGCRSESLAVSVRPGVAPARFVMFRRGHRPGVYGGQKSSRAVGPACPFSISFWIKVSAVT